MATPSLLGPAALDQIRETVRAVRGAADIHPMREMRNHDVPPTGFAAALLGKKLIPVNISGFTGLEVRYAWRQVRRHASQGWTLFQGGLNSTRGGDPFGLYAINTEEWLFREGQCNGIVGLPVDDVLITAVAPIVTMRIPARGGFRLRAEFARPVPVMFPVRLELQNGDPGDLTTQCSFTYSLQDVDGLSIHNGDEFEPVKRRTAVGAYSPPAAGEVGVAMWQQSLLFAPQLFIRLWDANEVPLTCAP